MPLRLALAVAAVAACLPVAPASASWYPAQPIDAAVDFGGLDLARDGTGALVYVRPGGHVYLSRFAGGAWGAAERVDVGVDTEATGPVVASADGGRLVVAWSSARTVWAASADSTTAPLAAPQAVGPGGAPSVDLAIQGTAFVVYEDAGDIRAVRLRKGAWEAVAAPLDVDPLQGASAPRVAVAADGNAVVVWQEGHADGRRRVYGRRVTGLAPSAFPQEVSLPALGDAAAGDADSPDVAIEDDVSFAWVVWRQDFGGVSRAVARRLVGSLFEAPAALDPAGGAGPPQVAMNGDGVGLAAVAGESVSVSLLTRDAFGGPAPFGALGASVLVAAAENRHSAVAWVGPNGLSARYVERDAAAAPEVQLGLPGVAGAEMAADRAGDFAVGLVESGTVWVSVWDAPPGAATLRTNRGWKNQAQPLFRWGAGLDLWGAQAFDVLIDGRQVGRTSKTSLPSPDVLTDGAHKWQVVSLDARGQATYSRSRYVRVDTTPPRVRVRVSGPRRIGAALRVAVKARDALSGLGTARIDYGDGSPATTLVRTTHRYLRAGRRRLSVRVPDLAGNVARRSVRLRIR